MYLTQTPGIGGKIKTKLEDFIVEEVPLYSPSGEGNHIYLYIEKRNTSTLELISELKKTFQLKDSEIGVAGWKDKQAITRQWISIPESKFTDKKLSVKILEQKKHTNKLRTNHLKGNIFNITIRDTKPNSLKHAEETLKILKEKGLPNYYGKQRFGIDAKNPEKGKQILLNKRKESPRLRRFLVSSYSSYLFNRYLDFRIQNNLFNKFISGDVAKKHDTGGLFIVEDIKKEQERLDRFEISPTGPIFGKKMIAPRNESETIENKILEEEKIKKELFNSQPGTRRFLRVKIEDVLIEEDKNIKLNFFLPAGSYATVLLNEVMKLF